MDFLDKAMDVALAAAKEAGKIQLKYYESGLELGIKEGNIRNIVTNADKEADAAIRKVIAEAFPEHTIITEEGAAKQGNEYEWHVDPIDGTKNYSTKGKYFCASIALAKADNLLLGVVYNPVTKECYTALKGKGSFLNGKKIIAAKVEKIEDAVICTDLCNEVGKRKTTLAVIGELVQAKTIRILGSGALAVCEVAAGNVDGYFNICGSSWDFAAAALILLEAGGVATSPSGKQWTARDSRGIIATNKHLYSAIFRAMKE